VSTVSSGLPPVPRVPAVPRPLGPLGELRRDWGDAYRIGYGAGRGWRAERRDQTGAPLTAADPGGLRDKLRDDYGARPVPREAAP
jgi:hypothetical protein